MVKLQDGVDSHQNHECVGTGLNVNPMELAKEPGLRQEDLVVDNVIKPLEELPDSRLAKVRSVETEEFQNHGFAGWNAKVEDFIDWMQHSSCDCGMVNRVHCCPYTVGKG